MNDEMVTLPRVVLKKLIDLAHGAAVYAAHVDAAAARAARAADAADAAGYEYLKG
jgi:hypothetical protein